MLSKADCGGSLVGCVTIDTSLCAAAGTDEREGVRVETRE